ncbi:MAG: sigma 54-dependent Fis family transcriptional regulator [Deltaproteobacteria bacterium]|nr:sigma 54-dependent Fis family transcriptional regulator [Deltaproteobacteria bacterium]
MTDDARATATEAFPAADAAASHVRRLHIEVVDGPDAGASFASSRERVVIGTHASADLVLADPSVSRFHCELTLSARDVVVRDLGSKNGTTVDGVVVIAAHLHHRAILAVGRTRLRVDLGDDRVEVPLSSSDRFGGLVGRSRAMRAVFAQLERAARGDGSVLLQGETGTGKDLAAVALHRASDRSAGPFVSINMAAIAPTLLESELFGHERGAFTGADRQHIGAFELASGGVLFLDEVGELGLSLQPKLLRALETRQVRRVGGQHTIDVDVRFVAATHQNLRREVNAGRFRADLFYRLATWEIALPPLRERPEDLPITIEALIASGLAVGEAAERLRSPRMLAELARHAWPGNVRELRNYLERAAVLSDTAPSVGEPRGPAPVPPIDLAQPLREVRDQHVRWVERRYLEALLREHGDNVSAAARAAGLDRVHMHRLLSRVGLR